jgi:hypothetical protein
MSARIVRLAAVAATMAIVSGCARTSGVMDGGNGMYLISAHASAIRGGATEADAIAYKTAQKFCAQKGPGLHAIVMTADERDVYQSSVGGSWNRAGGSVAGGTFASGNANFRFRCDAS